MHADGIGRVRAEIRQVDPHAEPVTGATHERLQQFDRDVFTYIPRQELGEVDAGVRITAVCCLVTHEVHWNTDRSRSAGIEVIG